MKRNILYLFYLFVFTIIASEILLRIYDPFKMSVSGNKINLLKNYTRHIHNDRYEKLDKEIIVKKNSLGFRGPEPDNNKCKILVVGGSTTECLFINEGHTWPDLLANKLGGKYWVNNAGMDGHSSFGHILLMKNFIVPLQPDVVLFLVGCNDVGRDDLNRFDNSLNTHNTFEKLAEYSKLAGLLLNLKRQHKASQLNLEHGKHLTLSDNIPLILSSQYIDSVLSIETVRLPRYYKRLGLLIALSKSAGIKPIFITQPILLGKGCDNITGVNLETYRIKDNLNGLLYWKELELYNDVTRKICADSNIHLIDLARLMPKSTDYYYDFMHYDNKGCKEVADIIYKEFPKQLFKNE